MSVLQQRGLKLYLQYVFYTEVGNVQLLDAFLQVDLQVFVALPYEFADFGCQT